MSLPLEPLPEPEDPLSVALAVMVPAVVPVAVSLLLPESVVPLEVAELEALAVCDADPLPVPDSSPTVTVLLEVCDPFPVSPPVLSPHETHSASAQHPNAKASSFIDRQCRADRRSGVG